MNIIECNSVQQYFDTLISSIRGHGGHYISYRKDENQFRFVDRDNIYCLSKQKFIQFSQLKYSMIGIVLGLSEVALAEYKYNLVLTAILKRGANLKDFDSLTVWDLAMASWDMSEE